MYCVLYGDVVIPPSQPPLPAPVDNGRGGSNDVLDDNFDCVKGATGIDDWAPIIVAVPVVVVVVDDRGCKAAALPPVVAVVDRGRANGWSCCLWLSV